MKKLNLNLLAIIGVLSLFLIGQASQAHADDDRRGGGGGHMKKMMEDLDLTDDQKTKIKEIHEKFKESNKDNHDKIKTAHENLRNKMTSDASNDELRKLHLELMQLKITMGTKRFENMLEIRSILTDEQRKKFKGFGPKPPHRGGKPWKHEQDEDRDHD